MKKLVILVIILALVYIGVKLSIGSPEEGIPSATEQTASAPQQEETLVSQTIDAISADRVTVSFTGYGPGKEHTGTITAKDSSLSLQNGVFSGAVTLDMSSLTSTPDKLVEHLKSAEFFDVAKYPTASFTVTNASTTEVKGDLTIKGITKAVSLPVSFEQASATYTSKVTIDMELFGIKQAFANKEFVVALSVK